MDPIQRLVQVIQTVPAAHKEISVLLSAVDDAHRPTARLLSLALDAARLAVDLDFGFLDERPSAETRYYRTWPGEHYRLLGALMQVLKPKTVVEFGTSTGMGAVTLSRFLPPGAQLHTFDLLPWATFPNTWFAKADFDGQRIVQHLDNLSEPAGFGRHTDLLSRAEFIFIDGPKDYETEKALLRNLAGLVFLNDPIVMFDDIRLLNMIEQWRALPRPKLDVTSFGHWSGTGLVDWNGR